MSECIRPIMPSSLLSAVKDARVDMQLFLPAALGPLGLGLSIFQSQPYKTAASIRIVLFSDC